MGFLKWPVWISMLVLLLACGCARYEYVIHEPGSLARTVTKQPARADHPPLAYEFTEGRRTLAVGIVNPGDQPITLNGNRSFVVDPRGETHPIRGATIAPKSFISMLLPPQPPVMRAGPTFSFGLGMGHYRPYHHGYYGSHFGYYDHPFYGAPREYHYAGGDPLYWDWRSGTVRLRLSYDQAGATNPVEHNFVIERRKQK